ncbi:MAG: hypothetical protein Q7J35_00920 [Candidatus Methanoperedens sp.]|nr:hypothetical protein [Candidatus Methanoperedens sp.]
MLYSMSSLRSCSKHSDLNYNILKLMFKEEFRLQASFFNRSYFLFSSLTIVLFTFIMGATLPLLRRAVAIEDMILVAHWVLLFYGLSVGGFAMFGDRILERRFGSVSLLLGSGYTLPIRFRRLFLLFYIKDTLYYVFFTILPMILGLALASVFVPISFSSLFYLFVSLTLSFLIGISISVLLFAVLARIGVSGLVIAAAGGSYIWFAGIDIKVVAAQLPPLVFYHSHSFYIVLEVLIISLLLGVISSFFIKETPTPHERKAKEAFMRTLSLTSRMVSKYGPMLSKDILDLVRSGIIFPVILTFMTPLLFLYAVTWFVESVMLWNFSFSLLFYAAMVGFFCTLLYSWLSNVDISECYNSLPLSMPHVIRTKLILFLFFICVVAVPYLVAVGYLKGEMDLLLIGLFIMFTVSSYVGSVLAYLTGLFTNSYLLDAKILLQFSLFVVPVLLAETLLSFYYPVSSEFSTLYLTVIGLVLVAASILFLSKLDSRWKGRMFRIS